MKLSIAERFFCAAMLLLVCFIGSPALAGRYWIATTDNAVFSESSNWSESDGGEAATSAPSTSTGTVYFNGYKNGKIVFDTKANVSSAVRLDTANESPFIWTATESGNGLTSSDSLYVGYTSGKTPDCLQIDSGTYSFKNLLVANAAGITAGVVVNGGSVTLGGGDSSIGFSSSSSPECSLTINDGRVFVNANCLYVGDKCPGALTLNNGELIMKDTDQYGINPGHADGSTSTITLNGGTLVTPIFRLKYVKAGSKILFNGTTVKPTRSTADVQGGTHFIAVNPNLLCEVSDNGLVIDTDGFDITISHDLVAAEGATTTPLVKKGDGVLTITGSTPFTSNNITVLGGTVVVGGIAYSLDEAIDASSGGDLGEQRMHGDKLEAWLSDEDFATNYATVYGAAGTKSLEMPMAVAVKVGDDRETYINLETGKRYEKTLGGVAFSFTTKNLAPRTLSIPTPGGDYVANVRDIGSWPLASLDGKRMNQGVIYRSGNLDGFAYATAEQRTASVLTELGVKTEIDLRRVGTDTSMDSAYRNLAADGTANSLAADDCAYYRFDMGHGSSSGTQISADDNGNFTNQIRKVFSTLAKSERRPALYHCQIGTDRTGIVSLLLLGFMGVEEETLYRDYLMSNFANIGGSRDPSVVDDFLHYLLRGDCNSGKYVYANNNYGKSVAARARAYLEMCGVTTAELDAIATALSGETAAQVLERVNAYEAAKQFRTVSFVPYPGSTATNAIHRLAASDTPPAPYGVAPTRTGYTFAGWNVEGETTPDANGESIIYASWNPGFEVVDTYYWKSSATEGAWGAAENWEKLENGERVAATSAPTGDDAAIFESTARITSLPSSPTSVRQIVIGSGCELVCAHGQQLSAQFVEGEGTLVLTANSDFKARSMASAIITKVRIDGTAKMTGNSNDLAVEGPLLGTGTLTLYLGATYKGVHLKGDNKDFQGTVIVDGNNSNRMKFAAATAGSASAVFQINGGTDNGSMTFSGGTIQFGEFKAPNGANIRCGTGPYVYEIGGKGTDFDMGRPDFVTASKVTVAKVGAGTMQFACYNYGTLELREGVAERTSSAANTLPTSKMVFTGGTFAFGAGGSADISALIKNSTDAVRLDVGSSDVTFDTALAASNSGGLEKSGSGTLTLTRVPLMSGGWKVFGGKLAIPAGAAFDTLEIADGAELQITDTYQQDGTYELFSVASAPSGDTLSRIKLTGISGNSTYGAPYVEDGKIKVVVSAESLVWNGDGENWTATDKWLGKSSQESKTFAPNDAVEFSVEAGAENTVIVDSAVSPSTVSVSAGEGGVQKFTGAGSLSASAWVNAGDTEYAAAGLSLGALTLTSSTFILAGNGSYTLPVPTGDGVLGVTGDAVLSLDKTGSFNQDFTLAGDGTFSLVSGQTFTVNKAKTASFGGTIEVPQNATLNGSKYSDPEADSLKIPRNLYEFGTGKVRVAGGRVNTGNTNATITNDIEVVAGTVSTWDGGNANLNIQGKLSGAGEVKFTTTQRGTELSGVNTNFAGTVEIYSSNSSNFRIGFAHWYSTSAFALWKLTTTITGDRNAAGYPRSYDLPNDASSNEHSVRFGAIEMPYEATVIRCVANPTYMVVGERESDESVVNGSFNHHTLHLTKAGANTLTLGPAVEMVEGTTIDVAAGELVVNSTNLVNATVTVESGAILSGSGVAGSITFNPGSKVRLSPDADTTQTYDLVRVPATTGGITFNARPEVVGPTPPKGKWKVEAVTVEEDNDGQPIAYIVLRAKFAPPGFTVIVM